MDEQLKEQVTTINDIAEDLIDYILTDSNVLNKLAKVYRRMLQELVAEGFSKSDAMSILVSIKLPNKLN